MMMNVDERIRYLLRVATRAEVEGDVRVARVFRRMAEDARPLDASDFEPLLIPTMGCAAE
ncbi:MAG: hypothetical protein OEZ65_04740 [Gemmatimonadota bacterium]|nr:hypothetical protein [Gemmatimonadota bacterium]